MFRLKATLHHGKSAAAGQAIAAPGSTRKWLAVAALALAAGGGLRLAAAWYGMREEPDTGPPLPALRVEPARTAYPGPASAPTLGETGALPPPNTAVPAPAGSRRPRTNLPSAGMPPDSAFRPPEYDGPRPARRPPHPAELPWLPPTEKAPAPRPPKRPRPAEPLPAPSRSVPPDEATIEIRNATPSPLEFDFGPGKLSGTVAPHTQIPVSLPGGTYNLKLRGAGHSDTIYDVEMERGRRYLVAFDTRRARISSQ